MRRSESWGLTRSGLFVGGGALALAIAGQAAAQTAPPATPIESKTDISETTANPSPIAAGQVSDRLPPVAPDQSVVPAQAVPATEPLAAPTVNDHDAIVVEARRRTPGDPLQGINAKSFSATQAADRAVVAPVAKSYERVVPKPVREGLRNVLKNLREPIVFLNYLLQLKPGKAAETVGRFVINSTIGGAGLFDIARRRPFNLPLRSNGFSDTLGYYGVKSGPFFFLPLLGPTTLRDLVGGSVDGLVLPTVVGSPFNKAAYTIPTGVVNALDHRVQFDDKLQELMRGPDPYAASRDYYLARRQAEIDAIHGKRRTKATPKETPAPPPVAAPAPPAAPITAPPQAAATPAP